MKGLFGITSEIHPEEPGDKNGYKIKDMYIWHPDIAPSFDHPIVRPYVPSYPVFYEGEYVYYYGDIESGHSSSAQVLTSWGEAPDAPQLYWNGIIVNKVTSGSSTVGPNTAVFFNMNFVESWSKGASADDWLNLAIRAICWHYGEGSYLKNTPVRLYFWRGGKVG